MTRGLERFRRAMLSRDFLLFFIRVYLGLVYLHFGFLKFFPGISDAEQLAKQVILEVTRYWIGAETALLLLATFECALGLAFLFGIRGGWIALAFVGHMAGTFLPLVLMPELTFKIFPVAPTLLGQYILKNVVFVPAGLLVLTEPRISRNRLFAALSTESAS